MNLSFGEHVVFFSLFPKRSEKANLRKKWNPKNCFFCKVLLPKNFGSLSKHGMDVEVETCLRNKP